MSTATISKLERNLHDPSKKIRHLVSRALGVEPGWIDRWSRRLERADSDDEELQSMLDDLPPFDLDTAGREVSRSLLDLAGRRHPVGDGGGQMLALLAAEEIAVVGLEAVARTGGDVWLDPEALTIQPGTDDDGIRVRRHDDNTFDVDMEDVDHHASRLAPRDPRRHRVRVPEQRDPEQLVEIYLSTVLDITLPDGRVVSVRRAAAEEEGAQPDAPRVELPAGAHSVIVLTAHNPEGRLLTRRESDLLMRRLRDTLKAETDLPVLDVDAHAPADRDPWSEPSIGALDLPADVARDLARIYEQTAWFEWHVRKGELWLHWTHGAREPDHVPAQVTTR